MKNPQRSKLRLRLSPPPATPSRRRACDSRWIFCRRTLYFQRGEGETTMRQSVGSSEKSFRACLFTRYPRNFSNVAKKEEEKISALPRREFVVSSLSVNRVFACVYFERLRTFYPPLVRRDSDDERASRESHEKYFDIVRINFLIDAGAGNEQSGFASRRLAVDGTMRVIWPTRAAESRLHS